MAKVKHIALVKFKESATPEQIDGLFEKLLDLSESIEGVEDYVAGTNNSTESLNQGYTHGFIMTFHDMAARDAYLTHADHEAFKQAHLPLIDAIAVFDFEV